jgi:hypothetical protein
MLIRKPILERIKSGDVTLAFRRWRRPSVKSGSTLRTAGGLVLIPVVSSCTRSEITNTDARKAGYSDREELLNELDRREGTIYRIRLAYAGEDPRIARREDADLNEDDLRETRTPTRALRPGLATRELDTQAPWSDRQSSDGACWTFGRESRSRERMAEDQRSQTQGPWINDQPSTRI